MSKQYDQLMTKRLLALELLCSKPLGLLFGRAKLRRENAISREVDAYPEEDIRNCTSYRDGIEVCIKAKGERTYRVGLFESFKFV